LATKLKTDYHTLTIIIDGLKQSADHDYRHGLCFSYVC